MWLASQKTRNVPANGGQAITGHRGHAYPDHFFYLLTWSLVALIPGPAVMCAMTQASHYGLRHALGFFGCRLITAIRMDT